MINREVFCPYERIAAIFIDRSLSTGFSRVQIDFETPVKALMVCEVAKGIDQNLGFSDAERLIALKSNKITGTVKFFKEGEVLSRSFEVVNDLYTDEPIVSSFQLVSGGEKLTNGKTASGRAIAYPEAAVTTFRDLSVIVEDGQEVSSVRPLYQYILIAQDDSALYLRGPGNALFQWSKSSLLQHGSSSYSLLDNRPNRQVMPVATQRGVVAQKKRVAVMLDCEGSLIPFVFGQTVIALNGKSLRASSSLAILKIAALYERVLGGDKTAEVALSKIKKVKFKDVTITVPVVTFNSVYRVDPDVLDEVEQYVDGFDFVRICFDRFSADENNIYLADRVTDSKEKGLIGIVSSTERSLSCFALSLAYLLNAHISGGVGTLIAILKGCLDAKLIYIKNGVLIGRTGKALESFTNVDFSIPGLHGCKFNMIRKTTQDIRTLSNGKAILGFNFRQDTQIGEPDHYIVVDIINGRAFCDYDPYRRDPIEYARDVSNLIDVKDSDGSKTGCYIVLEGSYSDAIAKTGLAMIGSALV